jgi:hypothetical protein
MTESYASFAAGWPGSKASVSWDLRDVLLYALSVGARPSEELPFLYEKFGPRVLPTYATRLAGTALYEFVTYLVPLGNSTLLVSTDVASHRSLPPRCLSAVATAHVGECRNDGDHLHLDLHVSIDDDEGPLSEITHTIRARNAASPDASSEPATPSGLVSTESAGWLLFEDDVREEQYAIWRLQERISLDEPLADEIHFDPEFTEQNNMGRPFITGECVLGFMYRGALRCIEKDRSGEISRIAAEFRGKVYPGDRLTTRLRWRSETEAELSVANQDGVIVLSGGHLTFAE